MDKEGLWKYAPVLLVGIALIFQYNLFVTPERLEQKHREILQEVSATYITKEHYKEQYDEIKVQLNDMQRKLDEIYKIVRKEHQ
jgi:hypothetical protein